MANIKLTGDIVKQMLKEAYMLGYEGSAELADEEVEALLKTYVENSMKVEEPKSLYDGPVTYDGGGFYKKKKPTRYD